MTNKLAKDCKEIFERKEGFQFEESENKFSIITDYQHLVKFRTFIKYSDLEEKLREAALICYDADYCEKSYNDEGDLILDRIYEQNIEALLRNPTFTTEEEKEKLKLLLDFMKKFNVNFIGD